MKLQLNKNETLVNFGNSILKYYECHNFNNSFTKLDEILNKHQNKKVCLILLDGFGKNIIEKYKEECPFLYSHSTLTFESVFPPTTVAATNALLLAKYPCETNYLGWTQYFKDLDMLIDIFPSINTLTSEKIKPPITSSVLANKNIIDLINENKKYKASQFMGFNFKNGDEYNLEALFEVASSHLKENDFVYIYSSEPDHTMHDFGINHENVKTKIKIIDNLLNKIILEHPEYLFLVIADHGMVNTSPININDYPEFKESIVHEIPIIEPRFAGFFVKNEEKFNQAYEKYFKDKFIKLSKNDVLKNNIFGHSKNYKKEFLENLCDYYLVSKKEYAFTKFNFYLLGNHAGGTKEELEINLSVFNN